MVSRIVSGGQTGADRAALDVALHLGIDCGGWVPNGRMAEDGVIPARYPNLVETKFDDPSIRTEYNVRDSDATLLITRGAPAGGSAFTVEVAMRLGKPVLHVDLLRESVEQIVPRVCQWLQDLHPVILNVAGPRASEDREIYNFTTVVLKCVFSALKSRMNIGPEL
ncbi:MAG TPA: putative molybdenum carrier protein [Nitrospirales bacterium]|nr:putative molybdenum carrier protein [Nitrospirales bacterium]